jgi:hypothetical protein
MPRIEFRSIVDQMENRKAEKKFVCWNFEWYEESNRLVSRMINVAVQSS